MAEISRAVLFGKLNPLAYRAIESATVFCKLRGNAYVELVHWLNQILQLQDSDVHRIAKHFALVPAAWRAISPRLSIGCRAGRPPSPTSPRTS
jgi:type VI secretion system protein VasG